VELESDPAPRRSIRCSPLRGPPAFSNLTGYRACATVLRLHGKHFPMRLVLVALMLGLGSCASIIHGTHDTITVNSLERGTTIYIDGVERGIDTATADVQRGKPHAIMVEKEGFQPVTIQTTEEFDSTTLLGVFIDFGIITIPVDLISGAAWKQSPTTYTITPRRIRKTAPEKVSALQS